MTVIRDVEAEDKAIIDVALLMAASARTAPKGRGVDNILTAIVTGEERERIAEAMERKMRQKNIYFDRP